MTTKSIENPKILLVGDYSSVQSNLSYALKQLGYDVTLASDGDGYKSLDRDVDLSIEQNKIKLVRKILNAFLVIGLGGLINYWRLRNKLKAFEGYDIVQIVNPVAINSLGSLGNMLLIRRLYKKNKKLFLLAIGDDYYWVKSTLRNQFGKSCFKRMTYLNSYRFIYSLKYVYGLFFKMLNDYAVSVSVKVIPGLVDYKMPYYWCEKCVEVVPLPVLEDDLKGGCINKKNGPFTIMNSWQKDKELRKGNDLFHEVMTVILENYPDRVRYVIPDNQPYAQYRNLVDEADIIFDQCFSLDRGMNALLSMARGKVVLTGWVDYTKKIYGEKYFGAAFDASDKKQMYEIIEKLICDPKLVNDTSKLAIQLIRDHHSALNVSRRYLQIWCGKSF